MRVPSSPRPQLPFGRAQVTALLLAVWTAGAPATPTAGPGRTPTPRTAEILRMTSTETAPGARIDLELSAPFDWHRNPDAEEAVVLELLNVRPGYGVVSRVFAGGLVESLRFASSGVPSRPVTRFVVTTRAPVDARIAADGRHLRIELVPRGTEFLAPSTPAPPTVLPGPAAPTRSAPPTPAPVPIVVGRAPDPVPPPPAPISPAELTPIALAGSREVAAAPDLPAVPEPSADAPPSFTLRPASPPPTPAPRTIAELPPSDPAPPRPTPQPLPVESSRAPLAPAGYRLSPAPPPPAPAVIEPLPDESGSRAPTRIEPPPLPSAPERTPDGPPRFLLASGAPPAVPTSRPIEALPRERTAPTQAPPPLAPPRASEPTRDAEARVRFATPMPEPVTPLPPVDGAVRLLAVEHLGEGVLRFVADGPLAWTGFRLTAPERFVIDLAGTVNATPLGTLTLEVGELLGLRISQYRETPTPVTRVIFDLRSAAVPEIERVANGLFVRLVRPARTP
jgi:hypothetical protein